MLVDADARAAARPSRRDRLRADALREITSAAMGQVREHGAAGLSLRAVARDVGMSSPGLYRYFASRDDLLTALISESYHDLASALETARDGAGPGLRERLRAVCLAYYTWAETDPARWSLVFGAPVPTYAAPVEGSTTIAVRRFGAVFSGLLAEAWDGHGEHVQGPPIIALSEGAVRTFAGVEVPDDPRFIGTAARLWCRLHGVIALGLFGHLLPSTVAADSVLRLYEAEVDDQLRVLGLD